MAGITIDLNKSDGAERIAEILRKEVKRGMKMAVVECMRQLSISTPVDTGRARFGYFCTVRSPSSSVPAAAPGGWKGESKGGTAYYAVPDIAVRIGEMGDFTVSDTLYITNNVPYIKRLNDGSSKQQPARFVERAAASAQIAVIRYLQSKQS